MWEAIVWIDIVVALTFSLVVLSRKKRVPTVTLTWILSFLLFPFLGVVLYLFVGYRNFTRQRKISRRSHHPSMRRIRRPKVPERAETEEVGLQGLVRNIAGFGPVGGNKVEVYEEAFQTYGALADAISKATRHVHLEYYIFQPDETGTHFRDLLIQKAKQGVECRVLLDDLGSRHARRRFSRPMREAGVQVSFFWPMRLGRLWGLHLRNHRKLAIIDGRVGFMGSQNIGDEYLQLRNRKLSWRDTQLRLEGPIVGQLQTVFLEDWEFATGTQLDPTGYHDFEEGAGGNSLQFFPTGPDEQEHAFEMVFLSLISMARHRITVVSPYFVPSVAMSIAIEGAARRGVDVQILIPRKSDNWVVDLAARSWCDDLVRAGASVFLHGGQFVHAKVMTVDGNVALLGSANMDERSFRLNFESSCVIYSDPLVQQLEASFGTMAASSWKVPREYYRNQGFLTRVRDGFFRVLSPLL